jgi:hypothetical protein
MADTTAKRTRMPARGGLLALAAAGLLLGGCGGTSSSHSSSAAGGAGQATVAQASSSASVQASTGSSRRTARHQQHAAGKGAGTVAATGAGRAASGSAGRQHLKVVDIRSGKQVQRASGGADEPVMPTIKAPNPCQLVSHAAAQAILGGPVVETEAPLGPTCIIKVGQQKQVVTLAVQTVQVSSQVHQMKQLQRATVAGHPAYCGKLGQSQLYLSLSGGKALTVTAPCGVAEALAAQAVGHLKA